MATVTASEHDEQARCTYCQQVIADGGTNYGSPDFPICEACMLNTVSMGLDDELLWED